MLERERGIGESESGREIRGREGEERERGMGERRVREEGREERERGREEERASGALHL